MAVQTLSIISQNVRGLQDKAKRMQFFHYMKQTEYDIIFLQETHSSVLEESEWSRQWGGQILFSHGTTNLKGAAIIFSNKLNYTINSVERDVDGRYLIVDLQTKGMDLCLCNMYAPNDDTPAFFEGIFSAVDQKECADRIIGGDFNLVLNVEKDRLRSTHNTHKAAAFVNNMITQGYVDIWQILKPDMKQYSWFGPSRRAGG